MNIITNWPSCSMHNPSYFTCCTMEKKKKRTRGSNGWIADSSINDYGIDSSGFASGSRKEVHMPSISLSFRQNSIAVENHRHVQFHLFRRDHDLSLFKRGKFFSGWGEERVYIKIGRKSYDKNYVLTVRKE